MTAELCLHPVWQLYSGGSYHGSTSRSLLYTQTLCMMHMMSPAQNGSTHIVDRLASVFVQWEKVVMCHPFCVLCQCLSAGSIRRTVFDQLNTHSFVFISNLLMITEYVLLTLGSLHVSCLLELLLYKKRRLSGA